jgi:hypothetical protein
MSHNSFRAALLMSAASLALAGCGGANDVASPGNGGVVINNPAPTPTPTPTPTPAMITPAGGCPTIADPQGLTDAGTITGPTGTWRVCSLPRTIRASITLPKVTGLLYQIPARVDVGCDGGFTRPTTAAPFASTTANCTTPLTNDTNVVLTIEPGVTLFGGSGASWLAVNRGNQINAVGTQTRPIVFTSRDNVLGLNSDSSSGQWGGVVLLGRAPTTDCNIGSLASNNCERETEGATDPARYGGTDNGYNAGRISYAQIRYSGFILSGNSELQSLTTGGVGTGTVLDHIQSHNSSDDAAEFFGGSPRMKYFIAVGAEDDNLDTDTGAKARFQHVIAIQRPGIGDAMIEADSDNSNDENVPRQNTYTANFTFNYRSIDANSDGAAILLRGKTDYTMINGVLTSPTNECLRISTADTATRGPNASLDEAGPPVFRAVNMECKANAPYLAGTGVTVADIAAAFGSGSNGNLDSFVSSLVNLYINGPNETGRPAVDPKTFDAFFDTTTYVGAVQNAANNWTTGWTCNSGTASFGTGNTGECLSLPTY